MKPDTNQGDEGCNIGGPPTVRGTVVMPGATWQYSTRDLNIMKPDTNQGDQGCYLGGLQLSDAPL